MLCPHPQSNQSQFSSIHVRQSGYSTNRCKLGSWYQPIGMDQLTQFLETAPSGQQPLNYCRLFAVSWFEIMGKVVAYMLMLQMTL